MNCEFCEICLEIIEDIEILKECKFMELIVVLQGVGVVV